MNKFKNFFSNLFYKFRAWAYRVMAQSYGMDDLNKFLFYCSLGLSLIQIFFRNQIVYYVSTALYILFFLRFFSKKKFKRAEENRKFRKFYRYYQLKWTNRKTHKVFRCKKCGQFIRVPRGKGKIETTCPNCGKKETHRS